MDFYDIAIIGGGFSGTMTAVNLAQLSAGKLKIALIERNSSPALGVAYSTTDQQHLLNVHAERMGAFADDPGHFLQWLQSQAHTKTFNARSFVPRQIYGQYLQAILQQMRNAYPNLIVLQQDVTDLQKLPDGVFELKSNSQNVCRAKSVVLALGHFPPGEKTKKAEAENPYAPEVWQRLAKPGDVLIIGTGLTSLDLVMTLARTKTKGTIHLLSRRGLLPRVHTTPTVYKSFINSDHMPRTALDLYRLVRKEIKQAECKGIAWQNVIDAMRPFNQHLWEALNEQEQRRFLRFLRPYWDVHRHRCAPEVMDVYEKLKAEGRVVLHRGHIIEQKYGPDKIDIIWRPHGATATQSFAVQQVVNCTGPQSDCRKLNDVLIKNLLAHDLIVPDRLYIGIATMNNYQTLSKALRPVAGLYALGSLLKGRLYESVAVPELRVQAHEVAKLLVNAHAKI